MPSLKVKPSLMKSVLASSVLLLASGAVFAQQQINLTAGPATATLPDGTPVQMWGYSCGAAASGSTASCAALNGAASSAVWSPVVITVPTNQVLQINLTNTLSFTPTGAATPNNIPTSLVIVGQLGGGLGTTATTTASPDHASMQANVTWPIAGTSGSPGAPPVQGPRVQSFATEVNVGIAPAATASQCPGTTAPAGCVALTWGNLRAGTYLIESGTHPSIQGPMGLYGILVVTTAPNTTTHAPGTAYPGVNYNAEVPLLFSEIDPVQNGAVDGAVRTTGFSESATLSATANVPLSTVVVTNGGSGYTSTPTVTFTGGGGTGATATATIDKTPGSATLGQVIGITLANPGTGYFTEPQVIISGGGGTGALASSYLSLAQALQNCSGGAKACYPPAVNYTPLYYLINGVAFDKTNASKSLFATAPASSSTSPVTGNVLVRLVNAGLRMHVPSIVNSQTGGAGASGFALIAEDGNALPGVPRVQSEVFMAAGKTYDVMINAPAACTPVAPATTCTIPALPVYDRELSLSGGAINRDSGMLAYIGVNGGTVPSTAGTTAQATAYPDSYSAVVPGQTLTISDQAKGVLANDINIFGVQVQTNPTHGTVTLSASGTFTYTPDATWSSTTPTISDTFGYCGNGATTGQACTTVTLSLTTLAGGSITCPAQTFTSMVATQVTIKPPGVLAGCVDSAGLPLSVLASSVKPATGLTLTADPYGGFTANGTAGQSYKFTFQAQNSVGTASAAATVTLNFPTANGPTVTVLDGSDKVTKIIDYRWVIEEDRTFYVDPKCTTNPLPAGCPTMSPTSTAPVNYGTNFHTSWMPVVATGCTGALSCESGQTLLGAQVVCDVGNGVCRTTGTQQATLDPSQVHLDPKKRYYISVLPGDASTPFQNAYADVPTNCTTTAATSTPGTSTTCGHGMGGANIAAGQTVVTVLTQPSPYPAAKLSVFVFEDDYPLNGEHDAGGGVDVLAANEPGLGGFEVILADDAGATGDATGQPTYDASNQPLTNSLAGTIDPVTGLDACPISSVVTNNVLNGDKTQKGIIGMIVTCPQYESDGKTLSPMVGQALINNLYQGRYGVIANPGADRIARGEEWLQTNTLDGQKAHDSFMRIGEPGSFQEFGPAGYHVTIGFANPKIINDRLASVCDGNLTCNNEVKGHVTTGRMSRTPDERLYGSGSRDEFSFTQCYVSLGDPDGADFAFTKCNADGSFDFTGIPAGNWKLTIFDQWNDQIVDGISQAVGLTGASNKMLDLGEIGAHQWQANIYTRTFLDTNGTGVSNAADPGLAFLPTNVRYRDGSFSNFNLTDLNGNAAFNEVFPLFNWYVVEADSTRYKTTGVHVVYDAGGPTDTTCDSTTAPCGSSAIGTHMANTYEQNPLPADLSLPGTVYCSEGADCQNSSIAGGPVPSSLTNHSTGRIDPPYWFGSYGWQGYSGQSNFLEFAKKPFAVGENGGIHGHVVYASTRPFDDPQLNLQTSWEPLVPHVRINLYQEGVAADGVTPTLTLIDHTDTTSFDDWAQGFRTDAQGNPVKAADGVSYVPNISCPGQTTNDPFYYGLLNQPQYLDWYNNVLHGNATSATPLAHNSQYKCYDGMHSWNQLQPAPYDGMYKFPSVTALDPATGKPAATNCTACTSNPDSTDPYRFGTPMLPSGNYVVEVVVPAGFELVKEEDKNILIGDNFIAPATVQFPGFGGSVYILPDQAAIGATYNANNLTNPTQRLGTTAVGGIDATKTEEQAWPCVGELRTVPDFISLYPQSAEVAPFAGATRPLCDRKEVQLTDQSTALAKFYVFTSAHLSAHYTGIILDDFTAEFDPYSPQFGEKFAPAYLPVSVKDWTGNEVSRVYTDQFGLYNGLSYSSWEVNPPNPTGYGPTMMVMCMNDHGTDTTPDPLFQPGYSDFCYELAFMPGRTGYFDTPVVPVSSFSEGYNHPDCSYPDLTPAIAEVDGDGVGPWVSAAGKTLTINALGDRLVDSYGYSGPSMNKAPFNQAKVNRHYGFGGTAGTVALIGSDGVAYPLTNVVWGDSTITGSVPNGLPACGLQQQTVYSGLPAQCGQLVITTANTAGTGQPSNAKQSVDTVTVTVGGKTPTRLAAGQTIQSAIDAASPGDLIIVPPGVYSEMVLMWKPVRLQGVGAVSSIINADPHPAGKLTPWRKQLVCLFGLTQDGRPNVGANADASCSSAWTAASGGPNFPTILVDRLPFEAILGWDATLNGNLAEQLIEPSLMGAYEGAGITVLSKGINLQSTDTDPFGAATGAAYTDGTVLLTAGDCLDNTGKNPYPGNFYCNPSSIDGLGVRNSSQGGGGIVIHAYAHNLQVANNRIYNNTGTMSGGITLGMGEHPDVNLGGAGATPTTSPPSCETSNVTNQALAFCYDVSVNIHNNSVTQNSSMGDELFSSTPAGAGGVSINTGADKYKFTKNWVCGNLSTGDAGGVAHIGFIKNGTIEHNSILFNQSTNPTITTNGGGLLVMGAPDQDPTCGANNDKDCVPNPSAVTPSDGTGPGLTINANLILGNAADSGSGGGLRLQHINGNDVLNFPNGSNPDQAKNWNRVDVTNNIIVNNVAGWDGAGVSLQDTLNANIVNNTIMDNDSTASSGDLFGSLFAPLASAPGQNCTQSSNTQSCPQVAGVVSVTNSAILQANLPTTGFTCPQGHGINGSCRYYSVPVLLNDVVWGNRSFYIGVAAPSGTGLANKQAQVTLYNSFGATPAANQAATGACPSGSSYWEIGVRGDTGPTNHAVQAGTTLRLFPSYSLLTDSADYPNANNQGAAANAQIVGNAYCNGSRSPPEAGAGAGWQVPPGTNETNAFPNPVFTLAPAAVVDEGNNWINLRWGPLALTNPMTGGMLGDYTLASGSPAIAHATNTAQSGVTPPAADFFDATRQVPYDIGAVKFAGLGPIMTVTPKPLSFGNVSVNTTKSLSVTVANSGAGALSLGTATITAGTTGNSQPARYTISGNNCPASLAGGLSCTISVTFAPTVTGANQTATLNVVAVNTASQTVALSGNGVVPMYMVTPASTNFGNEGVNTTSAVHNLTVTNTAFSPGNLVFTGVGNQVATIAGGTNGASTLFAVTAPTTGTACTTTTVLAPNQSCTIGVTFTPTSTGPKGTQNNPARVTPVVEVGAAGIPAGVYGSGVQATASLTGSGNWNATSGQRTFTLTNTGPTGTLLSVSTVSVNNATGGTQFSRTGGTCAAGTTKLDGGQSCTVLITRTRPSSGNRAGTGSLVVTDTGAATTTQTVNLSGS